MENNNNIKNNLKMKKIVLILATLCSSLLLQGQTEKKFYVNLHGGYALATANDNSAYLSMGISNYNYTQLSTNTYQLEIPKIGFGKGAQAGLSVGYIFNKYLGAEVSGDYFMGGNSEVTYQMLNGQHGVAKLYAKGYLVKPAVIFHAGFSKINPYVKLGLIVGKTKLYKEREDFGVLGNPNTVINNTEEFRGNLSLGYKGSFGMSYSLSSKIAVFGELDFNKIAFTPKESSYTKYVKDGVDLLGTFTASQVSSEYPSSYIGTTGSPDPNKPTIKPQFQTDLSSVGLSFGVNYTF